MGRFIETPDMWGILLWQTATFICSTTIYSYMIHSTSWWAWRIQPLLQTPRPVLNWGPLGDGCLHSYWQQAVFLSSHLIFRSDFQNMPTWFNKIKGPSLWETCETCPPEIWFYVKSVPTFSSCNTVWKNLDYQGVGNAEVNLQLWISWYGIWWHLCSL